MFIDLNEVTSIDLKRVAQPSFEHLGVKVIGTQMIDFDDIFMDSSENNKTRQIANENIAHIESLKQSFSKGIDLNQYPPCVIPTPFFCVSPPPSPPPPSRGSRMSTG